MIRDRRLTKAVHCRCATRAEMADSPGHDPDTLSGTHCLAGRPGNRTGCAVPGGRRRNRTPDLAVTLVFRTSRQPSSGAFHWYPCADSNREPPRSKRGTSTRLGYRGELVRAVGFEPTLPRLSTSCLLPIGLRAHGAAPRIRTETLTRFKLASSAIGIEPRIGRPEEC
jgi:hypothetical protein